MKIYNSDDGESAVLVITKADANVLIPTLLEASENSPRKRNLRKLANMLSDEVALF